MAFSFIRANLGLPHPRGGVSILPVYVSLISVVFPTRVGVFLIFFRVLFRDVGLPHPRGVLLTFS